MPALAQIVNISMDNHGTAYDGPFSGKGNQRIAYFQLCYTIISCLNIAEIA